MSMHQQNILFSQINQASAWIMPVGKLSIIYKPAGKAGEFLGEARRPHQLLTVQPLSSF